MSKQIDLANFANNLVLYLSAKVPADEINEFVLNNEKLVSDYIDELDQAINSHNDLRNNSNFPNREIYMNAIELSEKFNQDLPKFSLDVPVSVYQDLATNTYFKRIWQVRPINLLTVNILTLVYRTTVLHKNNLFDNDGQQLVQISSTIEEMAFYNYLNGGATLTFPAFKLWIEDWQDEGFDERLYKLVKAKNGV